jgi:MauM/NapG family ferredoxin protein
MTLDRDQWSRPYNGDECIMSDKEHISRRELLRGRFLGGLLKRAGDLVSDGPSQFAPDETSSLPMPAHESPRYRQSFPVLRPPGAIEEESFLDGCTKCNACVEACPHDAITQAPLRFRRAAGTPMIDPIKSPCRMCEDFPCIAACEPSVLRMAMPKKMGVARIDIFTCLAHTGSFCTVCSEHCPVDGAIEVTNGMPRIIEETCTGCGVCQHVCPAPANAVVLMPLAERPLPDDLKTVSNDAKPQAGSGGVMGVRDGE